MQTIRVTAGVAATGHFSGSSDESVQGSIRNHVTAGLTEQASRMPSSRMIGLIRRLLKPVACQVQLAFAVGPETGSCHALSNVQFGPV
jgi:hypothetical protein